MSALPKQVQQDIAAIEAMEKAMAAPPEGNTDPAQAPPINDAQPLEAQAQQDEQPSNVVELKQPDEWAEKYNVLRGKYDAEVPRLHQQNKELMGQMQQLQQQMADLAKPKQQEAQVERLVTEADETAFGADLIDVQRRVAQEVMREYVNPLKAELQKRDARIEQLETVLTRTQGDVTSMTFEQQLARAVPDFEQINSNPKWVAWLDEVDTFTGEPRRQYASFMYDQGNVAKVKQVVDLFKQQTGADTQKANDDQRQAELRRQVQPNRTTSSAQTPAQTERVYTSAEMDRLWDKVGLLNRQGKYDEAKQLESDLSNAYVQGRIRP